MPMTNQQSDLKSETQFIRQILNSAHVVRAYHIDHPDSLFGSVHSHPDIHHISYIVSGYSKAKIGQKTFILPSGSIVFVKAGIPHCSFPEFESSRLELMEVKFSMRARLPAGLSLTQGIIWRNEIRSVFHRLINEFYMERAHKEFMMRACLAQLIMVMMRARTMQSDGQKSMRIPPTVVKGRLDKAAGYIQQNYAGAVNLKDIASAARMSPSHLEHQFREHLGISPVHYLINLRLNHALRLMENTDLKLVVVAERVGITNPYYFSRLFKKHYGLSPRAYISSVYQRQKSAN